MVVSITCFSIVLGELVPKRIGQITPEPIARIISRPLKWLSIAAKPFVCLLASSTQSVLSLLEGASSGAIEKAEGDLMRNVFRLDDRKIASFMIPRGDLDWLDVGRPWSENQGEQPDLAALAAQPVFVPAVPPCRKKTRVPTTR